MMIDLYDESLPADFVSLCNRSYQRCLRSAHKHYIPGWFRYDKDEKSDYQARMKVLKRRHGNQAIAVMIEEMQAHLNGFTDHAGNWYCGFCGIWPVWFMNYARMLGYPDLHQFAARVETRDVVGYDSYLHAVKHSSVVLIENAVWSMRQALTVECKDELVSSRRIA